MPCGVDIIGIEKICAVYRCCEDIRLTARKTGYNAGQVYYVVSTYYDPED